MQATAKIHSKGKLQLIHVKSIETRLLYIMLAFFSSILVRQKHWALFEHFSGIFPGKLIFPRK